MQENFFTFIKLLLLSLIIFGGSFLVAHAQSFTKQINYQGKVSSSGTGTTTPVADGDYDVTFSLYTVATGGTPIWTETWDAGTEQVTTEGGLFSILLGEYTSLDSVNFNQTLYLGVNFDNDGEFTPRREIGAVPTAFETERLDNLDSTQFLRSDESDTLSATSTNTALTVDQQGTGNAFEVTSNSTSYFLVDGSGNVGLGDATPDERFTVGPNSEFQVNASGAITAITGLSGATGTFDFSGTTLNVSTSTIDDIDEIDPALRSGIDTTLITGTAGASGDCAQFNADGDLVSSNAACDEEAQAPDGPTVVTSVIKADGTGDYTTISAWEAATDNDLVSADEMHIGLISDTTTYTNRVTIDGATTDSTRYRKLSVAESVRHDGTAGSGPIINPTADSHVFTVNEDFFQAEWLEITGWTGGSSEAFRVNGDEFTLSRSILHDAEDSDSDGVYFGASGITINVDNTIFYDIARTTVLVQNQQNVTANVTNVTAYNITTNAGTNYGAIGFDVNGARDNSGSVMVLQNVTAHSTNRDDFLVGAQGGSFAGSDYNASSDATAPGGNSLTNVTQADQFVSLTDGAEDFHLKAGADLIDAGIDLGSEFEIDIDGGARTTDWDIGADEDGVETGDNIAPAGTGDGTPGGGVGQIQFNDNGAFGGASDFYYSTTTGNVGIGTSNPSEQLSLTGGDFEQTISTDPTFVGEYDTPEFNSAADVFVSGSVAYAVNDGVGDGSGTSSLLVLDAADPTNPTLEGSLDTPGNAYGVSVAGSYAYIADGDSGLQIVDVRDATNPTLVGTYNTAGSARGLTVSGSYAYIADTASGLQVVDISDPTNPTLFGTYDTAGDAFEVAVSGSYAYVADLASGLQVIDISDPSDPTLSGTYATADSARGVTVSGSYAYVATLGSGTVVLDISDPSNPTLVGGGDADFDLGVMSAGSYIYIASNQTGLRVVDVSDPSSPVVVGTYDTDVNSVRNVQVSGSYAYFADDNFGIKILRLPTTRVPTLEAGTADIDQLSVAQNANINGSLSVDTGLSVGGNILGGRNFSVTEDGSFGNSLRVGFGANGTSTDVVSPFAKLSLTGGDFEQTISTDPVQVGFASSTDLDFADAVRVSGPYAYVVSQGSRTLTIFQKTNDGDPIQIGVVSDASMNGASDVAVAGSYAYVVSKNADAFTVIDVSDPSNPQIVQTIVDTDLDGVRSVELAGSYAYVTSNTAGTLTVIDISDPENPVKVSSITNTDLAGAWDLDIAGSYAYVGSDDYVVVVDISNPGNLTAVGSLTSANFVSIRGIKVSGAHVYATSFGNFTVIDVSDPANPVEVGNVDNNDLNGPNTEIDIAGSYAYMVVDNSNALYVFDISDPTNPVRVGGIASVDMNSARSVDVAENYAYIVSNASDSLTVLRIPGTHVPTLEAGVAKIDQLNVSQGALINGFLDVSTGLSVGGSLFTQGSLGVTGTSSFRSSVNIGTSTTIFSENTNIPSRSLVIGNGTLCVDDGGDNCNDAARDAGTIYANNVNVQSVDLAEQYPTLDDDLEAGDIVMLDPKNPVFVERFDYDGSETPKANEATLRAGSGATTTDFGVGGSQESAVLGTNTATNTEPEAPSEETSFTPRLLGVVSTEPGFLLGGFADEDFETRDATGTEPALRKVPLALSGRVPVKVSTANGDIALGDRIAPSSEAGVGMKAFPDSPQTIGIALESFDDDETGTIIVFIDNDYRTLSDSLSETGANTQFASLRSITGAWSLSEDGALVVERLRVKGEADLKEFTLFDKEDGKPYCVQVVRTSVEVLSGTCESRNSSLMAPVQEKEAQESPAIKQ